MLTLLEKLKSLQGILILEKRKPPGTRSARIAMEAERTAEVLLSHLARERANESR